jgi:hypothetical protein
MPTLLSDITRVRTERSLRYPLHYADLESCLAPQAGSVTGLSVRFTPWRLFPDTPVAENPRLGEHPLLKMDFDPEKPLAGSSTGAVEIDAQIYAAPADALSATGLTRKRLREILADAVVSLGCRDLGEQRWWLRLLLCTETCAVRCFSQCWTGLRPEDEKRVSIPLDADHAS